MSLLKRLNNLLPAPTIATSIRERPTIVTTQIKEIGNEISIYPMDGGERYITKGYNRNDSVYSIVSRNAEKCGQVRMYHLKVKRDEKKTAQEYQLLRKGSVNEKVVKELKKMEKAMTEDLVVDSPLSKLLNKPNRNQNQAEWIENIVGLKELQGEGNIWMNPGATGRPIEMMIIPKPQLNLVGDGVNPFDFLYYEFVLAGNLYRWSKDQVVMWRYSNPTEINITLEHLRGLAPLYSAMIMMQGMNEADLRVAISNKNGGASGLAFREDVTKEPSVDQKADMRNQFNSAVNSTEMAGKIAIMAGRWGYHNFASSVKDQQLIEQYGISFKRLCRIFKTPAGIFDEGNATYDNQKQFGRLWIYSKIAPICYSLTALLTESLVPKFDLDPERNLISSDVMSLQELSEDLKDQVAAIKDVWELTPNQKLEYLGFEKSDDPNMDKRYLPSGLTPLDQANEPIGGNLDAEMNLLNDTT